MTFSEDELAQVIQIVNRYNPQYEADFLTDKNTISIRTQHDMIHHSLVLELVKIFPQYHFYCHGDDYGTGIFMEPETFEEMDRRQMEALKQ